MKRARKEKKAARPGDGRATTDGALGLSDQMDAGEETRQRKRKVTEFTAENGVERKKEKRKVAEKQEMEKERMAPKFGQWSTASFENPDQQMKFFRLMGGFKKSNQPESLPPAGTEKANVALTKQGEQTLKQGLQNEFEKAQNLKQHRGAGLGFQSAASKIFYIDKNMSRSAKFED
ncbi:lysine-rich nucleolar protein 1 [Rhinatrema bivittatum]|uniref:lysine-rich nucleolar protein 1 n=1 Tax=Rhinatrema bivittatum TaxID=194408 RepID=UPI00112B513C|nr:lysine-rich nucleolar protein 1 [Rhinatrema bivittatum]XP_029432288.1 lysine-rich nucleolar protein 1 [Rhinatrema bivittatum]